MEQLDIDILGYNNAIFHVPLAISVCSAGKHDHVY
jgi:hypothetical protein